MYLLVKAELSRWQICKSLGVLTLARHSWHSKHPCWYCRIACLTLNTKYFLCILEKTLSDPRWHNFSSTSWMRSFVTGCLGSRAMGFTESVSSWWACRKCPPTLISWEVLELEGSAAAWVTCAVASNRVWKEMNRLASGYAGVVVVWVRPQKTDLQCSSLLSASSPLSFWGHWGDHFLHEAEG